MQGLLSHPSNIILQILNYRLNCPNNVALIQFNDPLFSVSNPCCRQRSHESHLQTGSITMYLYKPICIPANSIFFDCFSPSFRNHLRSLSGIPSFSRVHLPCVLYSPVSYFSMKLLKGYVTRKKQIID